MQMFNVSWCVFVLSILQRNSSYQWKSTVCFGTSICASLAFYVQGRKFSHSMIRGREGGGGIGNHENIIDQGCIYNNTTLDFIFCLGLNVPRRGSTTVHHTGWLKKHAKWDQITFNIQAQPDPSYYTDVRNQLWDVKELPPSNTNYYEFLRVCQQPASRSNILQRLKVTQWAAEWK